MSERMPNTPMDFMEQLKKEILAVLSEHERRAIERHNQLASYLINGPVKEPPIPDEIPNMEVIDPDFVLPQETGLSAPVGVTPEEKDHIENHKTIHMSCEWCRKAKYGQ